MTQPIRFCMNCGRPLSVNSNFCAGCGQPQPVEPIQPASPYAAPPGNAQPASPVARKRRPSVILIIVGLLLLVMALRIPAAQLFGIGASGVITVVKQEIDSSSDRMDYNYSVAYSFTTADGKHQTGSYNLNRVYNSGNLPNEGSVISVKYLPVLPFINFADGQDNIGWSTFLTLVIGVAILVLGATGVVNISRHR
jgi:hypothetical protein